MLIERQEKTPPVHAFSQPNKQKPGRISKSPDQNLSLARLATIAMPSASYPPAPNRLSLHSIKLAKENL